jgi:hypothetical protein
MYHPKKSSVWVKIQKQNETKRFETKNSEALSKSIHEANQKEEV